MFLSPTATNIKAQRESLGRALKKVPSLKATNKYTANVARFQRAGVFVAANPAILAGLYCQSPLATKTNILTCV